MTRDALGILEIGSWAAAMAALDAAEKAGSIELLQAELNDFSDVRSAVAAGSDMLRLMRVEFVADVIPAPTAVA